MTTYKSEAEVVRRYADMMESVGYKSHTHSLIDLYGAGVLFEAKLSSDLNDGATVAKCLAQALYYLRRVVLGQVTLEEPVKALAAIDSDEAVFATITPYIEELIGGKYDWSRAASDPDPVLVEKTKAIKTTRISTAGRNGVHTFLEMLRSLEDEIPLTLHVTRNNFSVAFGQWTEAVKTKDVKRLGPLFLSDLRKELVLGAGGRTLGMVGSADSIAIWPTKYREFWSLWKRPPEVSVLNHVQSHIDLFTDAVERSRKGEFYTPLTVASKCHEYMDAAYGDGWRSRMYVWDPCAGTGNLEQLLDMPADRLFLSTLEPKDVDIMRESGMFDGAALWAMDFLNTPRERWPEVLPKELLRVIAEEPQNLIVLMNPPYSDKANGQYDLAKDKTTKKGHALTHVKTLMVADNLAKASTDLLCQFLWITTKWLPKSQLTMVAQPKFIQGQSTKAMRPKLNRRLASGFVISSKHFNLKGEFPIVVANYPPADGWQVAEVDVLDKQLQKEGSYLLSDTECPINDWTVSAKNDTQLLPLSDAMTTRAVTKQNCLSWNSAAIGSMMRVGNDLQNAKKCRIGSAPFYVNSVSVLASNLSTALVHCAARHVPEQHWLTQKEQLEVPFCDRDNTAKHGNVGSTKLPREFVTDCAVFVAFHACNQTAAADLTYEGKQHRLHNWMLPFPASELLVMLSAANDTTNYNRARTLQNSPLADLLAAGPLSDEANALLAAGKAVYEKFVAARAAGELDDDEFKLNYPDSSWWQVRKSLEAAKLASDELENLRTVRNALREKLRKGLMEQGICRRA